MTTEADLRLADDLSNYYADALGHVLFSYPWDTDPAIQVVDWTSVDHFVDPKTGIIYDLRPNSVDTITFKEWMKPFRERYPAVRFGPDKWACETLDQISEEVKKRGFNGLKAVKAIQFATSSGHGIGKSTLVAWVIKWIMDTRPFAKGTVTANTAEQLRTKTWAELGKWHKRSLTAHWFQYNSGRGNMSLKHVRHEEEWYCSAQTCREENSEAFAGQHAATSTSFYIFDEASAVPDKIYEVREGGTTDGEPMVFDFGNPTRNSGRFYEEVEGKFKHRYSHRVVDSRTVLITNKARIQEWIEDYGIDSDFVKVRVLGQFPSAGSLQFMPTAWVKRAMLRELVYDRNSICTIGVDVARFGDDDSVIYPVVGRDARSFAPIPGDGVYHGLDNVQLAHKVIEKVVYLRSNGLYVASIFVDVGGTGSGTADVLRHAGYPVVDVNFGNSAVIQPELYRFRSDEMWGRCRDAIKTSLILPELPHDVSEQGMVVAQAVGGPASRLLSDLTQREFGYTLNGNKIHLETKKDMKARGLSSPDLADALCLNFAEEALRTNDQRGDLMHRPIVSNCEFDHLADVTVN